MTMERPTRKMKGARRKRMGRGRESERARERERENERKMERCVIRGWGSRCNECRPTFSLPLIHKRIKRGEIGSVRVYYAKIYLRP